MCVDGAYTIDEIDVKKGRITHVCIGEFSLNEIDCRNYRSIHFNRCKVCCAKFQSSLCSSV
jgi:hypothetical protein